MNTNTDRRLTDRRASVEQQIAFYMGQARLARSGITTRRSEEFYLRQVAYFRADLTNTQASA
jgi:hypothetical protein